MTLILLVAIFSWFNLNECAFTWRDLTQAELEQWYTPTDLCMMKSADKKGYPQHIKANECKEFSYGSSRLACKLTKCSDNTKSLFIASIYSGGVGMGSNKQPCFGNNEPFAMSMLILMNFHSKILCQLRLFLAHPSSVALLATPMPACLLLSMRLRVSPRLISVLFLLVTLQCVKS